MLRTHIKPDLYVLLSCIPSPLSLSLQDHWLWRVKDNAVMPGYPMLINVFWRGLPAKIDAVYENSEGRFVFFKGKDVFLFLRVILFHLQHNQAWHE